MTPLDIQPVVIWVIALSQLLTFGLTVWGLLSSGARANARRIDAHDAQLANHHARLQAVEQSLRSVPVKDDLHGLHLSISEMRGDVREMRAIMARLETVVTRHEDHLLEGGRR